MRNGPKCVSPGLQGYPADLMVGHVRTPGENIQKISVSLDPASATALHDLVHDGAPFSRLLRLYEESVLLLLLAPRKRKNWLQIGSEQAGPLVAANASAHAK